MEDEKRVEDEKKVEGRGQDGREGEGGRCKLVEGEGWKKNGE